MLMPFMPPHVSYKTHTLEDVVQGRFPCGVEGDSGKDMKRAKALGLFSCNVKGIDIFARCESDARPLIQYLEQGGTYGSLDFSRLLGYTEEEVKDYERVLLEDSPKSKFLSVAARLIK